MELIAPKNVRHVLVLVDPEAKSAPICSNPGHFIGPTACIEGYGGHYIMIQKAQVTGDLVLAPMPM